MWAAGIDPLTGAPAGDQTLAFNQNFNTLRRLFFTGGAAGSTLGTLTRNWLVGGSQAGGGQLVAASAQAEIAGTMEPTMTGRTRADFAVDLLLADPYFYGAAAGPTFSLNAPVTITNPGDEVAGFSQPVQAGGPPSGFTVTLTGALTAPVTLTNQTAGVSVTFGQTIPQGSTVILDVLGFTATVGGGNQGPTGLGPAGTTVTGLVTHSGARPWMVLLPGANVLTMTSASGGDAGAASVTYQPAYL